MSIRGRYIMIVAGIISIVAGIMWVVQSVFHEIYWLGVLSTALVVGGMIMLAYAFGDDVHEQLCVK